MGSTGIRAGIIGEIGLDVSSRRRGQLEGQFDAEEMKVLRAAARASTRTGAAITLHVINQSAKGWVSFLDTLVAEGADLRRVIVGHSCGKFPDLALMKEVVERGAFIECDELGAWTSWTGLSAATDRGRRVAAGIVAAIGAGYLDRLLISHDVSEPQMLKKNGGSGFTYIRDFFIPHLKSLGVTVEQVRAIMVENPRRALTLVAPRD